MWGTGSIFCREGSYFNIKVWKKNKNEKVWAKKVNICLRMSNCVIVMSLAKKIWVLRIYRECEIQVQTTKSNYIFCIWDQYDMYSTYIGFSCFFMMSSYRWYLWITRITNIQFWQYLIQNIHIIYAKCLHCVCLVCFSCIIMILYSIL